jgi:HK97 family phage prohead protease
MDEPRQTMMGLDDWKSLAKDGDAPSDVILHKSFDTEIKAEAGTRTVSFTISSEAPDRDNDSIKVAGWELGNFKKNPVVLWAHDYRSLPIARATDIRRDKVNGTLRAKAEFVPSDTPIVGEMADAVLSMLKGGFLNATSVGFRPLKHSFDDDRGGFDFEKTELLEFSVVPVPAHPEALQDDFLGLAKADGIDVTPIVAWAKSIVSQSEEEPVKTVTTTDFEMNELDIEPVKSEENVQPAAPGTVITIELSDELKAIVDKLEKAEDEPVLEVDFDPGEFRLELDDVEDKSEEPVEFDVDELRDLVKQTVHDAIHEQVATKTREAVNALRGRID